MRNIWYLEKEISMELSRRSFLKGVVVTGAATIATGAAGCSPSAKRAASSDAAKTSALHTWEVAPEPITDVASTEEYDVVVVGAGLAGCNAAQAAAAAGAKVVLIEQASQYTAHGAYNACIGATIQKEAGIEIDPLEAARLLFRASQQTANYDLLKTWATRSGEVMDRVIDLCKDKGVQATIAVGQSAKGDWNTLPETWREFQTALFFGPISDLGNADDTGAYPEHFLVEALLESAQENGAKVIYKTRAAQLVGDASGVTGVIAKDENGYVQYNASKGVILATGGISSNKEMIDCWCPIVNRADFSYYFPEGGESGDGINMGKWIGAAISKSPAAPMVHPYDANLTMTALDMAWLAVNKLGERYGCEVPYEPYITNSRMNQPGNWGYSIFDGNYEEYVKKQHPDSYENIINGAADILTEATSKGKMYTAKSLEDLAKQLDVPVDTFLATIDRYNRYCEKGKDDDFDTPERFLAPIKVAPFYAVPVPANTLCVPFGLHVDKNSQVCTEEDAPINGLYAVGNAQGDFFGLAYPMPCPGVSHGRCIFFGQLVGEAVAKGVTIQDV